MCCSRRAANAALAAFLCLACVATVALPALQFYAIGVGVDATSTHAADRSALVDLFTAAGGVNWGVSGWASYVSGSDPCDAAWQGVVCSGNRIVYVCPTRARVAWCWLVAVLLVVVMVPMVW